MAADAELTALSARVPADVVEALDRIAAVLERPRSWVVVRALRQYVAGEGAELMAEAAGLAELDAGGGHDVDAVLAEATRIIGAARRKRRRAG